jgi:hypothetical protein
MHEVEQAAVLPGAEGTPQHRQHRVGVREADEGEVEPATGRFREAAFDQLDQHSWIVAVDRRQREIDLAPRLAGPRQVRESSETPQQVQRGPQGGDPGMIAADDGLPYARLVPQCQATGDAPIGPVHDEVARAEATNPSFQTDANW